MGWVSMDGPRHQCRKPLIVAQKGLFAFNDGATWKCDDPACGAVWQVGRDEDGWKVWQELAGPKSDPPKLGELAKRVARQLPKDIPDREGVAVAVLRILVAYGAVEVDIRAS